MLNNSHLKYRPDIDGLRALAILLVIIFHAYPKLLRGGFIGVDIFFVISGYLITTIILKGLNQDDFSLLDFYSRRIKRIFPALIVVLTFCLISGWFILLAEEYRFLGKHIASGAFYISNFILESESGYFDTEAELKPLLHLWSLSIEEQFYLVFPVLLILVFRLHLNPALIILLGLIFSFFLNISQIESNLTKVFFFPHTRAWELLIGSSVSYINLYLRQGFNDIAQRILLHRVVDKEIALANFLSWFGFALIIVAWFGFNHKKILFPGGWALMPAIGAASLILAGEQAWLNKHVFSNKIAVFIGLISYPLYLWHWPLLSFMRLVEMDKPSSTLRFLALILSFFLAWLTYHLIEKKLRHRKHWAITIGLFSCLALIGVLGYQVKQQEGYPDRFNFSVQLAEEIGIEPWEDKGLLTQKMCLNRFGQYFYCLFENNNEPITAMLIGDSHANHLYPGLLQHTSITGGNLLNIGKGNCLHFSNRQNEIYINQGRECQSFINKVFDFAISTDSVETVILAGAWGGSLKKKKKSYLNKIGFKSKDLNSNFQTAMRNTLQSLLSAGKKVIFVMDIPALDFKPSSCIQRPWRISKELLKEPCASLRSSIYSKTQEFNNLLLQVLTEFPQVKIWDPTHAFCDKTYCWAVKEGKMLYRDVDHLNETGSLYLGKHFKLL